MKFNLIKVIFLSVMLLSLSCSVSAEAINLDLRSAVNRALENNLDFQIASIELDKSRLEYQKKKANFLLQQSLYSDLEAEISLSSAENTYQNTNNQIIKSTIGQYSGLWLSDLDLEIKNKSVELEKIRLQEAQAQYEIGDIGSINLLEQENAYKDAQFSLETASDDYQQDIKEFIIDLNLGDTEFILSELGYTESWQINENEAINTALENSVTLVLKKKQVELAEIDLERAEVSAAELDKKIKEKLAETTRLQEKKSREEIVYNVQQTYYQFKQAVKRIDLTRERLTGAEEKYRLREEQFKAGLITRFEVLEYEINMLQTRYNYLSAIADYYLKEQTLRENMGLKSGVLLDGTTEN